MLFTTNRILIYFWLWPITVFNFNSFPVLRFFFFKNNQGTEIIFNVFVPCCNIEIAPKSCLRCNSISYFSIFRNQKKNNKIQID